MANQASEQGTHRPVHVWLKIRTGGQSRKRHLPTPFHNIPKPPADLSETQFHWNFFFCAEWLEMPICVSKKQQWYPSSFVKHPWKNRIDLYVSQLWGALWAITYPFPGNLGWEKNPLFGPLLFLQLFSSLLNHPRKTRKKTSLGWKEVYFPWGLQLWLWNESTQMVKKPLRCVIHKPKNLLNRQIGVRVFESHPNSYQKCSFGWFSHLAPKRWKGSTHMDIDNKSSHRNKSTPPLQNENPCSCVAARRKLELPAPFVPLYVLECKHKTIRKWPTNQHLKAFLWNAVIAHKTGKYPTTKYKSKHDALRASKYYWSRKQGKGQRSNWFLVSSSQRE